MDQYPMSIWQSSIPQISTPGLISLAIDAEARIGSHVAGGDPLPEFIEKQQKLLSLIQDELSKRS
jgi:hypothetical protein